jgi:type I restriction enzyme S subunit
MTFGSSVVIGDVVRRPVETVDPRRTPDREFTYIDISSVDSRSKSITNPKRLVGRDAPSRARQVVRRGDVLVATTRPYLNAVALVPDTFDGEVCSTGFAVLRPMEPLDSEYLWYWVRHPDFINGLAELIQGALYPAVTDRQVLSRPIPMPPLDEQRRIAARLTAQLAAVDQLRFRAHAERRMLLDLASAVLAHAFEGSSETARVRHQGAPLLGSRAVPLGELCHIRIGRTPSRAKPEYWGGDIPWATISDLQGPTLSETREGITALAVQEARMEPVPAGTLLFSFKLSIGKMSVAESSMFTNEAIAALTPRDPKSLDRDYLRFALMTVDTGEGSSMAVKGRTLNSTSLADIQIPWRSIDTQRRIAARLTAQLQRIAEAERALDVRSAAIGNLPAAIVREAFESAE